MNGTTQWQKDTTFTTQWNYKQEIRLVEERHHCLQSITQ